MPGHRQRGLALITAMLIVAIAAAVAAAIGLRQEIWLRQTQNLADRAQEQAIRAAALDWVALLLARGATRTSTDDLTQPWAQPLPPLPVAGGAVTGRAVDAQGRFNLNNLVRSGVPSANDIIVFRRLLALLDLNPDLANAVVDWMDGGGGNPISGVGDAYYLGLDPPYRAGDQALTSVDELRLIRGFDEQTVDRLRDYVTVLPTPTDINVDTASATVITAMVNNMPLDSAKALVAERDQQPFASAAAFAARLAPGWAPLVPYSVRTSYFLVHIDVHYGRLDRRTEALVDRPIGGRPAILWHEPLITFAPDPEHHGDHS